MVGRDESRELGDSLATLGEYRSNVLALHPLPKPLLYGVLKGARAAILPSLADNLPNASIESLQHGVPIIGSNGASLDEIVEVGVTGELAELGNIQELSDLIVKFWQEKSAVLPGFVWEGFPGHSNSTTRLLEFLGQA